MAGNGAAAAIRPSRQKVVICVISYRRPNGLARLLTALDRQIFERSPTPELTLLVVDNDPEGSAAPVCEVARATLTIPVEYRLESRRGIPYARNAAVEHVGASADLIAFVDDDEVPEPSWLDALITAQADYQADVVTGPVIAEFEDPPPAWVVKGGFFNRERRPTGSQVTVARTGNVLIRTSVFGAMHPAFDERLALTGGSDTHFFLRVWRAGFKLIWADDAIIREWVVGSRITVPYVLRRSYRIGNTRGICERDFGRARGQQSVGALRAAWWIAKGVSSLPVAAFRGTHAVLLSARGICIGAGYFAGRIGVRFEEYRTTDGR